jgi:hypothetical protein
MATHKIVRLSEYALMPRDTNWVLSFTDTKNERYALE